jgi:UDP-glucose 6-dehydrogenase
MLYIITPVSRPENLEEIANSFNNHLEYSKTPNTNIRWIIILDKKLIQSNDSDEEFVLLELVKLMLKTLESKVRVTVFFSEISNAFVGHAHRNYFLDKIYPGLGISENDYAYFLDDDTIFHPEFLENVLPILEKENPEIVVFGQNNKNN